MGFFSSTDLRIWDVFTMFLEYVMFFSNNIRICDIFLQCPYSMRCFLALAMFSSNDLTICDVSCNVGETKFNLGVKKYRVLRLSVLAHIELCVIWYGMHRYFLSGSHFIVYISMDGGGALCYVPTPVSYITGSLVKKCSGCHSTQCRYTGVSSFLSWFASLNNRAFRNLLCNPQKSVHTSPGYSDCNYRGCQSFYKFNNGIYRKVYD